MTVTPFSGVGVPGLGSDVRTSDAGPPEGDRHT